MTDTPYRPPMIPSSRTPSNHRPHLFLINHQRGKLIPVIAVKVVKGEKRKSLPQQLQQQQLRPHLPKLLFLHRGIICLPGEWLALRQETGTPLIESSQSGFFSFLFGSISPLSPLFLHHLSLLYPSFPFRLKKVEVTTEILRLCTQFRIFSRCMTSCTQYIMGKEYQSSKMKYHKLFDF